MVEGQEPRNMNRREALRTIGGAAVGFAAGVLTGSTQLREKSDTAGSIILPDVHMVPMEGVSEKVFMQKGAREILKKATFIRFDEKTGHVRFINPDGKVENEINPREDIVNVQVKIPDPSSMQFTYFYPGGGETLTVKHEFLGGYISFHNTWANPVQGDKASPPDRK